MSAVRSTLIALLTITSALPAFAAGNRSSRW